MAHYPWHSLIGLLLLAVTLGLRALTVNRLVRSRLRISALLAVAYVALDVATWFAATAPFEPRLRSLEHLVLALLVINTLVFALVNPLRADRVPEGFPSILQDAIVVVLFVLAATFLYRETLVTISAVSAVVIGFALQDTLGNAFAGLALQMDQPFSVGHWVRIGEHEGRVHEVTWRATKLRTKSGNLVVLPNNVVSREPVTNYSEPEAPVRLEVEVGATYLKPPNEVKAAIQEAISHAPLVLRDPPPDVLLVAFDNSAITYRARVWTTAYERDQVVRDQVRTAIYYAFRRHGIEIPWPIQVEYSGEPEDVGLLSDLETRLSLVGKVAVLAPLADEERGVLAANGRERLFGDDEVIVQQDAEGRSMFVIAKGGVRVAVDPGEREVARLGAGDYFGEMSLLAGAPRNATVRAVGDTTVLEITAEVFRQVALQNPGVVERVGQVALRRQQELDQTRAAAAAGVAEPAGTFFDRIRKFLKLTR